jgi:hypothetical protein
VQSKCLSVFVSVVANTEYVLFPIVSVGSIFHFPTCDHDEKQRSPLDGSFNPITSHMVQTRLGCQDQGNILLGRIVFMQEKTLVLPPVLHPLVATIEMEA